MKVLFHRQFKKSFKKRIAQHPKLVLRFKERLGIFIENPHDPILRTHHLVGDKMDLKSFSVTGDIRVVYCEESDETALFLDVGTHNQVY